MNLRERDDSPGESRRTSARDPLLPAKLPDDPIALFAEWAAEARASGHANTNAMTIATATIVPVSDTNAAGHEDGRIGEIRPGDGSARRGYKARVHPGANETPDVDCLGDPEGHGVKYVARPSARMVLCKAIRPTKAAADGSGADLPPGGCIEFYTDSGSRKGSELLANPEAACVFHWPFLDRQVRIEGPVTRLDAAESDKYWASRPVASRAAAASSSQSRPLDSRAELADRAEALEALGPEGAPPRPKDWCGYLVWVRSIELWCHDPFRLHDRAVWTRDLGEMTVRTGSDGAKVASYENPGPFSSTRLQP